MTRVIRAALRSGVVVSLIIPLCGAGSTSRPVTRPSAGPATAPTTLPATLPVAAPASRPIAVATPTSQPAPSVLARAIPQPLPSDPDVITDAQIGRAIERGVDYLLAQFDTNKYFLADPREVRRRRNPADAKEATMLEGQSILAVHALLQAGVACPELPKLRVKDVTIGRLIDEMKRIDIPEQDSYAVYARALRAAALAVYDRPEDRDQLKADVQWLITATDAGSYSYYKLIPGDPLAGVRPGAPLPKPRIRWDQSNSQYGLLGVWSGAEVGVEVPSAYWALVYNHWATTQSNAGTWRYAFWHPRPPSLSMTCGGIASMLVTYDYLMPARAGHGGDPVGRDPFPPQVQKALNWMETGDNSVKIEGDWSGYQLYGVERVGLASGFKHFGQHDWFRELSRQVLVAQGHNGSWGNDIVGTAYCVLFLSRGRHPNLLNKLRFAKAPRVAPGGAAPAPGAAVRQSASDGFWANRPRDASNLARFAGRAIERPLNWQVVHLNNTEWTEWTDAPILLLSSHLPVKLAPGDADKIRRYVEAGGMLFTHADGDSKAFNDFARQLAKELFPKYELVDLPAGHPILTKDSLFQLQPPLPPLKMVSNGSRVLMLHSDTDVSRYWQTRDEKVHRTAFELGVNLFVYAAGKVDYRNRLELLHVAPPGDQAPPPPHTVPIARVRYGGNWDPEPGAWRNYANSFRRQTSYALDVQPVDLAKLCAAATPLAHLTGTSRYDFTPQEAEAVRRYVTEGGVLLIDRCGGAGPFDQGVLAMLGKAFGEPPKPIPADHPLLLARPGGSEDLSRRRLRVDVIGRVGPEFAPLAVLPAGKGLVIFSSIDVTTGLLGANTVGILGFEPRYAQALTKNAIFWALDSP